MTVSVDWVASASNKADKLSRVPASSGKYAKAAYMPLDVTALVGKTVVHAVLLDEIAKSQKLDVDISRTVNSVSCGGDIANVYKSVKHQLVLSYGVLYRSVKLPPNDVCIVPVVPKVLQSRVVCRAHAIPGHGNWEVTWRLLRSSCFFPNMAAVCQALVQSCANCVAANTARAGASHTVRPVRPWSYHFWSRLVRESRPEKR